MSRYEEPPNEILDLGRPRRGEKTTAPRALPPMHIGEGSIEDDGGASRPPWWQWLVLVLAVLAALIVGVLGSNARRDAADLAAAESTVELIAGTPEIIGMPDIPFQLPLYNSGPLEVELLSVRPEGWSLADDATRRPIRLPPDTWVMVRVHHAAPDCTEGTSPDVLETRVRTQARERTISVPLPDAGLMSEVRRAVCLPAGSAGAFVEEVESVPASTPDTLTMRLQMRAFDPSQRFALVDVTASAPGFRMIDASLPVQFEPGGARSFPLDLTWQIVGCADTQILNDITLGLAFQDENGTAQTAGADLPGRGVAELARFAVAQCGAD